jgi:CYTH domain-containing protein
MAHTKEIEYKFLIDDLNIITSLTVDRTEEILQGYLTRSTDGAAIRVRASKWDNGHEEAFITVKSPSKGMSRDEFEYEIPVAHAEAMMALCEGRFIMKTRYFIKHGEHTVELDVFGGELTGLVMAEIEVKSEDEKIEFPEYFGRNVTLDPAFTNIHLSEHGLPAGCF